MPRVVWDKVGARTFESGLDRGVLYLPNGSAVPWNGLTSVIEKTETQTTPIYYDGMKISELPSLGDFSATMKAVTYPEEFTELEGYGEYRRGLFVGEQPPQVFGLSYRTRIGNDLEGPEVGYKLHILYNLTAIPHDKTYATISKDPSLVEFEWDLTAIPEETPGFRPTANFIIDSRDFDPWLLEDVEAKLYGSISADALLPPLQDLLEFIDGWYRVQIVDNGDGTWTATSMREGFIQLLNNKGLFQIVEINAIYLDDDTFEISDTTDISEVPQVVVVDNGDGTWTASTDQDGIIVEISPDEFEIRNVDVEFFGPDFYRFSNVVA